MNARRTVVDLPLDLIDDSGRLRPVDPSYALLLAESIEGRGLDTPIQVAEPDSAGRHRLIAGAHRVAAFRLLERRTIPALVVRADEIQARLIEIDENLMRRELSELDRGAFLAERKRLHEAMHGRRRGGDRRSRDYQTTKSASLHNWSPRFTADVAARVGLSEDSIKRSIARFEGLAEDVRDQLRGSWIASNGVALDKLRKLSAAQQRDVLERLSAEDRPSSAFALAVAAATGREAPASPDSFDQFVALWRRLDRRTRDRVRAFINQNGEDDQ